MVKVSKLNVIISLMLFSTMICCFALMNPTSLANGSNNRNDTTTCSLSYTPNTDSHTVTMSGGVYIKDIGISIFNSTCSDNAGFSVYVVGSSDNEFGNNKMAATINDVRSPEYDITTGTARFGDTSNWAVKITPIGDDYTPTIENGFDTYSAIPAAYSRVASFDASTDSIIGSSLQSSYAIYTTSAQPAGAYSGRVKYTLVHPHDEQPCGYRQICYKENGDNVVGKMNKQSVSENEVILWASNFSREGYGFAGWNTEPDGSGISYGPNEAITFPSDAIDGLTLYAMWVAPAKDSSENNLTFQTDNLLTTTLQDGTILLDKPNGYVTALIDERDNDVYAIARLADGNYWMIENLRLDNDADFTESLSQGFGKSTQYGSFIGLAEPENSRFVEYSREANSLYYIETPSGTATVDIGNSWGAYNRIPRYNNRNTSNRVSIMTNPDSNVYSYGNYYNWAAAHGNTIYYNGPDGQDENGKTSDTAGTSICPAGWRLPYGSNTGNGAVVGGFLYLDETLGGTGTLSNGDLRWSAYPNNFVFSGLFNYNMAAYRGSDGSFWSSTSKDADVAYSASIDKKWGILPGFYTNKNYANTMRCTIPTVRWYDVRVDFDSGVKKVTIKNDLYGSYTLDTSGQSVSLAGGVSYSISATFATTVDKFSSWSTTENGTLGSASTNKTTYEISGSATLSLASREVCASGRICYRNSGSDSANAVNIQSVSDSVTSVNLKAPNFKRSGYGFAGWNTEKDGSGTTYGPNETITFDPTGEKGLILYPTWVASAGSLQDWTCPSEASMPIGTVTALTDERDGDTYAVAKLADGKCWMIENMRLDTEDTVGDENRALSQGYASGFTGLAEPETGNFTNSTTQNSLYTTNTAATTLNVITGDNLGSRFPRYRNDNTNGSVTGVVATDSRQAYAYGNYYTYAAAIADTSDHTVSGESASTSICPKGWRLPIGGTRDSNNDYWELIVDKLNNGVLPAGSGGGIYEGDPEGAEVSKIVRAFPNNFVVSGYMYNGSSVNGRGNRGDYWSATTSSGTTAYRFSFREQGVNPGTVALEKYDGLTVRCVSEYAGINGLEYMQDFAGLTEEEKDEVFDSMVEGEQYVLKDSRDDKKYYISKLADGNVWMTQNLDFDIVNGGADINSSNTNVPDDWSDAGNLTDTNASNVGEWDRHTTASRSYDAGDLCWRGSITATDQSDAAPCANSLQDQADHSHVGNYYNWTAAVAMSDSSSYTVEGTDVNQSICPAGWTLPKGGVEPRTNSFASLVNQQNLTSGESGNAHRAPAYLTYSGAWEGGDVNSLGIGVVGMYHSSTVQSDFTAFRLSLGPYNTGAAAIDGFYRGTAYSIRCMVGSSDATQNIYDLDYMQEFMNLDSAKKEQIIGSMVESEQYQLKDSRDNKIYYVSRLADGNVWMTQNLDFDIVNGGAAINSTNTDVPVDWADAGNLTDTYATSRTSWNNYYEAPESYDPGDVCWDGAIFLPPGDYTDLAHHASACGDDRHYHIGNYYNWTAAVAMSDSSSYTTPSEDVGQSLCPAGWKLPKAIDNGGSGSFDYMIKQLNLSAGTLGNIQNSPVFFTYGGDWNGNSEGVGTDSAYWSSSVSSDDVANDLYFSAQDDLYVEGGGYRDYGHALRCILR